MGVDVGGERPGRPTGPDAPRHRVTAGAPAVDLRGAPGDPFEQFGVGAAGPEQFQVVGQGGRPNTHGATARRSGRPLYRTMRAVSAMPHEEEGGRRGAHTVGGAGRGQGPGRIGGGQTGSVEPGASVSATSTPDSRASAPIGPARRRSACPARPRSPGRPDRAAHGDQRGAGGIGVPAPRNHPGPWRAMRATCDTSRRCGPAPSAVPPAAGTSLSTRWKGSDCSVASQLTTPTPRGHVMRRWTFDHDRRRLRPPGASAIAASTEAATRRCPRRCTPRSHRRR